jgi:hypothetical protein
MKLKFKNGVRLTQKNLHPHSYRILEVALETAEDLFPNYIPTVTSACDGKHMITSKHYEGMAYDLRVKDLPKETKLDNAVVVSALAWTAKMKDKLGSDYDVILHGKGQNLHVHAEFDRK